MPSDTDLQEVRADMVLPPQASGCRSSQTLNIGWEEGEPWMQNPRCKKRRKKR